jgi:arginase
MALRTLLGDGPVEYTGELERFLRPQQVFLAGTRDLDPPEVAYCSEMEISISPSEEFVTPEILVRRIREREFKNVYLHLDLDVLNPESFPNSLMPTRGGPSIAEVQTMLKALSDNFEVVGFSIVEYCERGGEIRDLRKLVRESGITIGSTRDLA